MVQSIRFSLHHPSRWAIFDHDAIPINCLHNINIMAFNNLSIFNENVEVIEVCIAYYHC